MDKLEPCPFCGGRATHRYNHRYYVGCWECSLRMSVAAWNTRAKTVPLSTQDALDCTIEHLDGIHTGKIVVDIDVFNTLYEAARESLE